MYVILAWIFIPWLCRIDFGEVRGEKMAISNGKWSSCNLLASMTFRRKARNICNVQATRGRSNLLINMEGLISLEDGAKTDYSSDVGKFQTTTKRKGLIRDIKNRKNGGIALLRN